MACPRRLVLLKLLLRREIYDEASAWARHNDYNLLVDVNDDDDDEMMMMMMVVLLFSACDNMRGP